MIFERTTRTTARGRAFALLVGAALSLGQPLGCVWVEQSSGIELTLEVEHEAAESQALDGNPAGREFVTDAGMHVWLSYAYLTVSQVALVPCENSAHTLLSAWRGVAWAHGVTSATVMASPLVNGLERPDAQRESLGTLKPPPGAYCALNVRFEPADADAAKLPAEPNMVGQTLRMVGTWQLPDQAVPQDLFVSTAQSAQVQLPLPDGALVLDDANSRPTVRLTLHYDQWLNTVAATQGDPDLLAMSILQAMQDSLTVTVAGGL